MAIIDQNTQTPSNDYMLEFESTEKCSQGPYRTHIWNCKNQLNINDYLTKTSYNFKEGGWIKESDRTCGYEICVTDEFKNTENIIYLIVIFDKIIKGGKCKGKLTKRTYPAGTQKSWSKGTPSETNYIYSQIFRMCLKKNIKVKFYIFQAQTYRVSYPTPDGKIKYKEISPYEEMETSLNAHLKETLGRKLIGDGSLDTVFMKE